MKKNKDIIPFRICCVICAALGWWGILYPELTMTPSTYTIVSADGSVQNAEEVVEWEFDSDIYQEILNADSSRIHFKSRLLTNIKELQEQGSEIHDSGK